MRWQGRKRSENVEDRRAMPSGRVALGGMGGLLLILIVWCLGGNPMQVIRFLAQNPPPAQNEAPAPQPDDEVADFVSVVLHDTEQVWGQLFAQMGQKYREPKLVLFRDAVQSACGFQSAAVGPFYCPEDEHVYIDLTTCRRGKCVLPR